MDHETVLNRIFAATCIGKPPVGDIRCFEYDLHCAVVYIVARLLPYDETPKYEVLYFDMQDFFNDEAQDKMYVFAKGIV